MFESYFEIVLNIKGFGFIFWILFDIMMCCNGVSRWGIYYLVGY